MGMWVASQIARYWVAGGDMAAPLVLNELTEAVPGAGSVVLGMDFGNIPEVIAGDLVASCAVSILTVSSPALTATAASVPAGGYTSIAAFSGGLAGTSYSIKWTPTLVSGQVLPPRTGVLVLQ